MFGQQLISALQIYSSWVKASQRYCWCSGNQAKTTPCQTCCQSGWWDPDTSKFRSSPINFQSQCFLLLWSQTQEESSKTLSTTQEAQVLSSSSENMSPPDNSYAPELVLEILDSERFSDVEVLNGPAGSSDEICVIPSPTYRLNATSDVSTEPVTQRYSPVYKSLSDYEGEYPSPS